MKKLFLTLLVAVPLASSVLAQSASERLTVHYVEVPVTVVDRSGDPVRGLTAANFEVYDGKKRIKTLSFDTIDFTNRESIKAAQGNPAARRVFLLLFDLAFSSPASLKRAQTAALTFVGQNIQRRDLVGVGTIDEQRGFKLLVAFTTDRAAALQAIADPFTYRGSDPLQIGNSLSSQVSLSELLGTDISGLLNLDGGLRETGGAVGREAEYFQHLIEITRLAQREDDAYARGRIEKQFDVLGSIALMLDSIKGRKQIVYLTEGFDPTLIRGKESRNDQEAKDNLNNIISGNGVGLYKVDSDKYFGSFSSLTRLADMAKYFRGSDVMLHAIDIQGARVQNSVTDGSRVNSNDALFLVARPTGGTVFQNANNVKDDFARLLHQQEVVYILGFQAPVVEAGKFHDLNVKLVNGPSGATVTHRAGYFESGTTNSAVEHTITAAEVILKDIPQNDIKVAAMAAAFPAVVDKAQVPIVVEINGSDLLKAAKGNDLAAEIFVYAFDEDGIVRDRVYQRLALDTEKVGDKLRANGVKYISTLSLPPGKYAIKTLVRTPENDKKGFMRNDVVVPKANETVLLPPFVLDDPDSWLLVKGDDRPYLFHVNGTPFVPSATGHPPAGAVQKLAVFIWNAKPQELTWETTPQATLLAQLQSEDATKLVLQLDRPASGGSFGITVHKTGVPAALTASTTLSQ